MLAKKYRLPVQSTLGKKGSVVRGRYFTFKGFNSPLTYSRFGAVVSKQAAKKASQRVLLRRLIYNAVRPSSIAIPSRDIVVIASPAAITAEKDVMIKELSQFFK